MAEFDVFDYAKRDEAYWSQLEQLITEQEFGIADVLSDFPAYIRRRDLARLIAHYELFRNVIDLPGCIVELGVFKGASLFTWAKLLETFCAGDRTRKVFGFDHFEGFTRLHEKDGAEDARSDKVLSGFRSSAAAIRVLVEMHNADNLMPSIERVRVIEGDLIETLPKFLNEHPGLRISLLHLDVDVYEPTKAALELLYPLVVNGGVVVLDEYGLMPWEGESKAVEEYFAARGCAPQIRKFPFVQNPHGYFFKPAT